MAAQPPQQNAIKKQLSDAVGATYGHIQEPGSGSMLSFGSYDLQLCSSTPWFDNWRDAFLHVLPASDHEYLNHCLACVFVVASNNGDPLGTFTALANQQVTQQQQFPNKLPRWFCQGILHYYVLLHDMVDGDQTRADSIYQNMKSTFGVQICHLLQVNSRSINTAGSIKTAQPDPWSQFLLKPSQSTDEVDGESLPITDGSPSFPSRLSEMTQDQNQTTHLTDSLYDNMEESGSSGITSSSSVDQFSHPLASPTTPPSRDTPSPDSDPTAAASGYQGDYRTSNASHYKWHERTSKTHGQCLTPSDLDRLRIFMHEFVVRALVPWVERQMKMLSEQVTSRKAIHRSFFSATKKWFGNKPQGPVPSSQNTTVVYTKDAPELQLRRLGDLAFLFQMYDFAYHTYHTAKKDFNNDQAWLHFAGALEMASLSLFLQGPNTQKQYPHHYMETAISTYLAYSRNPQYATRATLTSTEALKKKGMFNDAAMQFLKMTSEDSDLTSALFLEQAAHCFLALKTPMVRKYSFHMILAGHRFNKAGQRKHSLRAYTQALQIYKARHWSIAEDHIHFTIGRQSFNLKHLEKAAASFKHLLVQESKQPTSQQAAFLREYLFVYKQLLSQEDRDNSTYGQLPELPLPIIDSNATKVLLTSGKRQKEPGSRKTLASGVGFDSHAEDMAKWENLEERILSVVGRPGKSSPPLFTNSTDNQASPVAFVGEAITVEVQVENPLHVMLVLSEVTLLWTFLPAIQGSDPPQVISNEITTNVKKSLADEIIQTSVVKEVIVQGIQNEHIQLTMTPRQPGQLRVVGLAYNLGTSSLAQNSAGLQTDSNTGITNQVVKPSYTSSVVVRGKQKLEPRGPRLNKTKEDRTQKHYGPDRRLDLLVQEEMPILEVSFLDFPESLLCGEVQCIEVEFTNKGKSPLHGLRVTSSHPRFFTFGLFPNGTNTTSTAPQQPQPPTAKYPFVYQMRAPHCGAIGPSLTSTVSTSIIGGSGYQPSADVLNIPLSDCQEGQLMPGQEVKLPMWIRGDDIGGVHEVDFLFYYEPVKSLSTVKHRVVHHQAVLNTVESLSVRTTVVRPAASNGSSNGQELNSCIFACELENLSQVQVQRPHVQELQVTQVSCVSPHWTLLSLGAKNNSGVRLGSRETLQLVMKGLKQDQKTETIGNLVFSEVAFDRDQVNTSCSPCSDFYWRSWLRHQALTGSDCGNSDFPSPPGFGSGSNNPGAMRGKSIMSSSMISTDATPGSGTLESAVYLKLTLVFLWKAWAVQESGQMRIVVGQHHVHINRLNTVAMSYPVPASMSSLTSSSSGAAWAAKNTRPALKFIRRDSNSKADDSFGGTAGANSLDPEISTKLVSYSFSHAHQRSHPFDKGLCLVPVTLTLQNHSGKEVTVMVDTGKSPESFVSNPGTVVASPDSQSQQGLGVTGSTVPSMRWVGLTQASLTLEKGQSSTLSLRAGMTRPGTYNVNCLSIFVTFSSDQSQMILQRHSTPSIVTLVDSSASS
ncbi:trafficking protein particle complex subunit 8 [Elysia marginata]|uniref:Trafficking protein particle complex subunit 8 n=1 Tax=Elysia marginata TaxID=1093978 RepID=A0AAV4FNK3_9GAST|nr:trafficking protein particle complex subunit 8 [Elysia marginata]